jgi:predicted ATPase
MQAAVEGMLRDAVSRPGSPEACIAVRAQGVTSWFAGDFVASRAQLDQALARFDPERDLEFAFAFGQDIAVSAMAFLSLVLWPLSEFETEAQIAKAMDERAARTGHVGSIVYANCIRAHQHMLARDPAQAAVRLRAFFDLARVHEMPTWVAYGGAIDAWIGSREVGDGESLSRLRRNIAHLREQGFGIFMPLFQVLLAEAEAMAGEVEAAMATIERALEETARSGQKWQDAEAHRLRGDILRKRNPDQPQLAEEAYLSAIGVAKQQGAVSFELRAALALAKLYQSAARPVEAHDILAPALEGFEPTPEMPEIAEGQALLAAFPHGRASLG